LKLILYAILVSTHYFTSNGMNIDAKPKKAAKPTTSVTKAISSLLLSNLSLANLIGGM